MRSNDILLMAFKNIIRSKTKFFLTFLSISIGICSVIIITTIGDIGSNVISEKLDSMGIDGIFITNKYTDSVLDMSVVADIEQNFDVLQAMPIISNIGAFSSSRVSSNAVIWGVDESLYDTLKINGLEGRCFNQNDIKNAHRVAIIDENLANNLYGRTNIIGKTISVVLNGATVELEIIGVISEQKELIDSVLGENSFEFIYIPYTMAQEFNQTESISQIAIRSSGDLDELCEKLEYYFSKKQEFDGMLEIQNISSYIEIISDIMQYLTIILSLVAGISMLVAGIGVLNMMLSSTIERKKEIGIYMALGARKNQVGKIFLAESVIICLFSGINGAIIGLIAVFIGTKTLNLPFFINVNYIFLVELISLICGVLAGFIPAIKASKQNPIDVLRE